MISQASNRAPEKGHRAALLFAMVFPTVMTWAYFVAAKDAPSWVQLGLVGPGKVLQFLFPLGWVLLVQRRKLKISRPKWRELAAGAAFGLTTIVAAIALYALWLKPPGPLAIVVPAVQEKITGFGLNSATGFIAMGAFYALFHSLGEEYYWRWFVFAELRRSVSVPQAVVISSLGFMAHHVIVLGTLFQWEPLPTVFFSVCVAAGGLAWSLIYQRYGTLWGVWLSHLLIDAMIFAIGFDLIRDQL